jgi:hypothetical protein
MDMGAILNGPETPLSSKELARPGDLRAGVSAENTSNLDSQQAELETEELLADLTAIIYSLVARSMVSGERSARRRRLCAS